MESCELFYLIITLITRYFHFFVFSFQFFLQLLCTSLVLLIFCYSAQIMLENAFFCRQNAHLKNRLSQNSFVEMILNRFLLPITEEIRLGTSQRTISTCVMYYSKFEPEQNAFIKVLTKW